MAFDSVGHSGYCKACVSIKVVVVGLVKKVVFLLFVTHSTVGFCKTLDQCLVAHTLDVCSQLFASIGTVRLDCPFYRSTLGGLFLRLGP
jgi:hypothetical protein